MDVAGWLRQLGLERYEPVFREHEIDWDVLAELTDADLEKLGLPLGPRKKLLKAIAALSAEPPAVRTAEVAQPAEPPAREAERRQLTVLFCDLVGSTELAARLDPEDMRNVIHDYQNAVAGAVVRFEGHVAKFLGDGVLAYFGWPRAHEDEAERAVHAGLAMVEAVQRLESSAGVALRCRIGIATGLVVVGDLVGDLVGDGPAREQAVVGETPNLAARLQGLAAPGTVVIADGTRRLLGRLFELEDLGTHAVKGFVEPVRAWRVLGEGATESRFEARQAAGPLPLVGREHEFALLLDRWALARQGEGQVVLLDGEAGIGKSRIVAALREHLRGEPHISVRYFCSPYHVNSALHPVIAQLKRAAGFARADPPSARLAKLEALLAQAVPDIGEATGLFAELLGIPVEQREGSDLTPQERRARTLRALLAQLEGLAASQSVLVVLEDAHWLDPSSLELFELLVDRIQRLPVLLVVTHRPEFEPPWRGYPHVTKLALNRLARAQALAMVEHLTGGRPLPPELLDLMLAKTEGVPLFVEELTKTVLESGLLREEAGGYALRGPLPPLAIPATLQDLLMARLDRLAAVKDLAQIGACIGREFDHELLEAVADLPAGRLEAALSELVHAELLFRRGTPPEATYAFKHTLVQEAAYASLLRERRRQLHARIAQVLEARAGQVPVEPETLARHLSEAGVIDKAIGYWREAAQRAFRQPALREAVAHARQGLALLDQVADEAERNRLEVPLRNMLGVALHAALGPVDEVEQAYARARALCTGLGDERQLYTALWGLWYFHEHRTDFEQAHELAAELLALGGRAADDPSQLQAHHANWTTCLFRGEPRRALEHAEQGMALYLEERDHPLVLSYGGHDAGVCSRYTTALSCWLLGRPDTAVEWAEDGVEIAERLADPVSLSIAIMYAATIRLARGEAGHAGELAGRLRALATEHGISVHRQTGAILQGAARAMGGEPAAGIVLIESGLAGLGAMGYRLRRSYFLGLLAEAHAREGDIAAALATLDDALGFVEQSGERWWEAEIHRMRGELLGRRNAEQAEAALHTALEVARLQEARSLELRAATSLARLWAEQRRVVQARELLGPVHGGFSEGFDTGDLRQARTLLEELA